MCVSDYRISGRPILEPTTGRWLSRDVVDVQGDGRPIYGSTRAFEMRWQLESYEQWSLLVATFNELQSSGTTVARLPAYPTLPFPMATGSAFAFQEYSGVVLSEPSVGAFFQDWPTDVTLLIANIVT